MIDEVLYKKLGRFISIKLNPDEDDLIVGIWDCCEIDGFVFVKGYIDKEYSKSFIRTNKPYIISEDNKKYYVIEYDEFDDGDIQNPDLKVLLTLTQNKYNHA
jgi:hypothetical protein